MNGQRVGLFTKASNGAHSFAYDRQWIELSTPVEI
ncbi:hypothetical protein [Vibrio sp. S17_S38]